MSNSAMYAHIRQNPKFQELVQRRGRFAWTLTAVVLTLFYGFFLTVAFSPETLGQPVAEGSMLTLGVAIELVLFITLWLLTAFYVRRANGEFDKINQEIIKDAASKGGQV